MSSLYYMILSYKVNRYGPIMITYVIKEFQFVHYCQRFFNCVAGIALFNKCRDSEVICFCRRYISCCSL